MLTEDPIKFKRDHHLRGQLFDSRSFEHQGRANLNLLAALLPYVPVGGLIVDPMAGTGSMLIGTDYQHPVVCGELEPHWVKICEANRKSIAGQRLFANSTPALAYRGNAASLPLAAGSVGAVITSPPYWDMLSDWHINSANIQNGGHPDYGLAYGVNPANIGNIHIYEDYLRAMAGVYREARRVLRPAGVLGLILKDRVHKGRIVPIVQDTITLCAALGFKLVKTINREVIPSMYRNMLAKSVPAVDRVNTEAALIFKKANNNPVQWAKIALVQGPKPNSAPSWQLYIKSLAYAVTRRRQVFVLGQNRLQWGHSTAIEGPAHPRYRQRRDYAFTALADIVTKYGFSSGAEIELHCSMGYGQYLAQRAQTLGFTPTYPTQGLNLGQKLRWYTERAA
jgi:hypothetical protein